MAGPTIEEIITDDNEVVATIVRHAAGLSSSIIATPSAPSTRCTPHGIALRSRCIVIRAGSCVQPAQLPLCCADITEQPNRRSFAKWLAIARTPPPLLRRPPKSPGC